MPNKRLENALNAGKLIQLGFNLNNSKPQKLELLYKVDCISKEVNFVSTVDKKIPPKSIPKIKNPNDSDYDSDQESVSEQESNSLSKSDADYDKVEILSLQFHEGQNLLATGDSNGEIQIYDVFSGIPLSFNDEPMNKKSNYDVHFSKRDKISSSFAYNMPIISMKWHPHSNYSYNFLYYAHVNGLIGVCDKETQKKTILVQEKDELSCIDFCMDGSVLASVGKDSMIRIYDSSINSSADLNKVVKTYGNNVLEQNSILTSISSTLSSIIGTNQSSTTHTNRLQCVKFSNTSNDLFFTGGWDRSVKAWDLRTSKGFVNAIPGPFVCGSDAIDVNDYLVLTASWVKENALELWDIRKFKKVCVLKIAQEKKNDENMSLSEKLRLQDGIVNEYLYACKFFSSSNHTIISNEEVKTSARASANYSTVLACGSGTQSLHLLDYEQPKGKQLLSSVNCQSPLYCLDSIYSCSMIACGGMKNFYTLMGTSNHNS